MLGIMSATNCLPNHLRPRRQKVFGPARGIPLDRNAKVRIMVFVQGYNARQRQKGQHRGPITRAFMEVRIPGSSRPRFREIVAHDSGVMSPTVPI